MVNLKAVYQAPNIRVAEDNLLILEEKWGKLILRRLALGPFNISTFFDYSEPYRKIIYITNTIESYHRNWGLVQSPKATNQRFHLPS